MPLMDRKGFFSDGLKQMLGGFLKSPAGQIVDTQLQGLSNVLAPEGLDQMLEEAEERRARTMRKSRSGRMPRPPGAIESVWFDSLCTRCGDCVQACPHQAIFRLEDGMGPALNPNETACRLCEDFPCISSCKEEALVAMEEDVLPKFGQARVLTRNCLNSESNRAKRKKEGAKRLTYCRECLNVCPITDAVRLNEKKLPVFARFCTGCGLCVHVCPPEPRAIGIKW